MSAVRRVLLAPDKFKGSLTAREVAAALARGLRQADPQLEITEVAVADGGDGTLAAAVAAGYERVPVEVTGPTGTPVSTAWARHGSAAVVEMADACGLERLGERRAPLAATSRGLGEALAAALDAGAESVVLGIGGSASTDGGAGFLRALGARVLDAAGHEIGEGGGALAATHHVDLSGLHPRLADVDLVVASDVDSPLLGAQGAAAVFGPQKGASSHDVRLLEQGLERWADALAAACGVDHRHRAGAGAAGGVGLAAGALGARFAPGIDLVLQLVDFDRHVRDVDLVVVGEGCLDEQTLRGKAPAGVAAAARDAGVRVVAVCGRRAVDDARLASAGISAAHALTDLEPDRAVCVRDAARLLEELAPRLL